MPLPSRVVAFAFALALTGASSLGGTASLGCASQTGDADDAPTDDGDGAPYSELISERQLSGRELAAKTISLTFDDGPGPRTAELAEYLAAEGVHATFFVNGKNIVGRQGVIDTIVRLGHLLANHTQNHLQLTKLGPERVAEEIGRTDELIAQAQPNGPSILRAPFGAWNGATARAANATALKKYVGSVFWEIGGELTDTSAADWACWSGGVSVERCGALYVNEIRTRGRGIVLMHDVHGKTIDMMKVILPTLKAEGYAFAPLTDVPSVKRALAAASGGAEETGGCASATLGRVVPEGSCVQSRADEKWNRCTGKDWVRVSAPTDPGCTGSTFPLE